MALACRKTGWLVGVWVLDTEVRCHTCLQSKLSRKLEGGAGGGRPKKVRRDGALTWEVPPPLELPAAESAGEKDADSASQEEEDRQPAVADDHSIPKPLVPASCLCGGAYDPDEHVRPWRHRRQRMGDPG